MVWLLTILGQSGERIRENIPSIEQINEKYGILKNKHKLCKQENIELKTENDRVTKNYDRLCTAVQDRFEKLNNDYEVAV